MVLMERVLIVAGAIPVLLVIYAAIRYLYEANMLWFVVTGFAVVFLGLGFLEYSGKERPENALIPVSDVTEQFSDSITDKVHDVLSGGYVSGNWDNKFIRNGNASQSFEFDRVQYN